MHFPFNMANLALLRVRQSLTSPCGSETVVSEDPACGLCVESAIDEDDVDASFSELVDTLTDDVVWWFRSADKDAVDVLGDDGGCAWMETRGASGARFEGGIEVSVRENSIVL